MPQIISRVDTQMPKTKQGGALIPVQQAQATAGMDGYYTIPITPAAPTNTLNSGNQLYFDIERDEIPHVNDMCLRFRISCTGSNVQLTPPAYFNRS